MEFRHLAVETSGKVATVTLSRPEVRNAMDETTLEELERCFKVLARGEARVAVLRGAGPDFCAGADVRWMRRAAEYGPARNRADARRLVRAIRAVDECPLPVIARVHGGVYGGGLGLAAACDVVVAGAGARMSFSECRLGILPAVVSSFVLPKIGLSHTRRLYLTAEVFGMETARSIGLVHEVVPEGQLDAKTASLAAEVLRNGPLALRTAKAYLRRMAELPFRARVKLSIETLVRSRSSPEGREGLKAFLEKRRPSWLEEGP